MIRTRTKRLPNVLNILPVIQRGAATVMLALGLAGSLRAATVLEDSFAINGAPYVNSNSVLTLVDATAPTGLNGGTGFSGGWLRYESGGSTNRLRTEKPGLDYTANSIDYLKTSIGSLRRYIRNSTPGGTDPVQGATVYRTLWSAGAPAAGDTIYFSFLTQFATSQNMNLGFTPGANNSSNAVWFSPSGSSTIVVNMRDTAGTNFTVDTGQAWATKTLFVGRIQSYGQTNQRLDIWLNPTDLANVGAITPTATLLSSNSVAGQTFDNLRAGAGAGAAGYLDEIRIAYGAGAGFANVLPTVVAPYQVRVETKADGTGVIVPATNLIAGQSFTVYAIGRDVANNFVANVPVSWSVTAFSGNVANSDIVPAVDGKSAVFTAHLVGSGIINVDAQTSGFVLTPSDTITVAAGAASQVRVETAPGFEGDTGGTVVPQQNLASATPLIVYAVVRDVGGNFITNDPSATWTMESETGGVTDANLVAGGAADATLTGSTAGTGTIKATLGALTSVQSGVITITEKLTWVGDGVNNVWDFTAGNWSSAATASTLFRDGTDATFDGTGSTNPPVNLTATVQPRITEATSSETYIISGVGKISSGNIVNSGSGTLVIATDNDSPGNINVNTGGGTVQIGNGGTNGTLSGGAVTINTGGRLAFNRSDTYRVTNSLSGNNGYWLEIRSGTVVINNNVENNNQRAHVKSGATLVLSNQLSRILGRLLPSNSTNMIIDAGGILRLGGGTASGDQIFHVDAKNHVINGLFDVNGTSEIIGVIQGSGVIDNSGASNAVLTVGENVNDNSVWTFSGALQDSGSGTLALVKTGANTLYLDGISTLSGGIIVNGGTLGGTGTLGGNLTVNAGGTLTPGTSVGTLTVPGNLTLNGTTVIELDRGGTPNSDRVTGIQSLTYGGTLIVTNAGAALELGDSFQLFSFASQSGSFSVTNLPPLGAGTNWTWNATTGVLTVGEPSAAPNPTNITYTVSSGQLVLSWPNGQGWTLQCQTNPLSIGLTTSGWTGVANTSPYTNASLFAPTVFYRLIYTNAP